MFADVTPEMRVFREEIFGPVLVATPFETEEEAMQARERDGVRPRRVRLDERADAGAPRRAGDRRRARLGQLAERPRPAHAVRRHEASGIGREGGDYSFEFYCELETIHVALGDHPIPRLGLGHEPRPDWVIRRSTSCAVAHVELTVTDLAASREFYVDVLGLVPTAETDDALYLRGYEERLHHSLVLRVGPAPLLDHIAYRVRSAADLDAVAAAYRALGCEVAEVEDVELGQGPAIRLHDPLGFPIEFFHEMEQAETLLQRYDLYRGARITRADHVNVYMPDVAAGFELYRALGFRCSEYIATTATSDCSRCGSTASDGARHRADDRRRPAAAPFRVHDRGDGVDHRALRHPRRAASRGRDRARARPARRLERVLRLPARSGRPPDRALHRRLLHRRPGPPADALERVGRATPDILGPPRSR